MLRFRVQIKVFWPETPEVQGLGVTISGMLGIPLVNLTDCEIRFRLLALMGEWQSGTL
jgi:hypothetical protein